MQQKDFQLKLICLWVMEIKPLYMFWSICVSHCEKNSGGDYSCSPLHFSRVSHFFLCEDIGARSAILLHRVDFSILLIYMHLYKVCKYSVESQWCSLSVLVHEGSPLGELHRCVRDGVKINVHIRTFKGLRGVCTGFLVAFDKFWNMVIILPAFIYNCCIDHVTFATALSKLRFEKIKVVLWFVKLMCSGTECWLWDINGTWCGWGWCI